MPTRSAGTLSVTPSWVNASGSGGGLQFGERVVNGLDRPVRHPRQPCGGCGIESRLPLWASAGRGAGATMPTAGPQGPGSHQRRSPAARCHASRGRDRTSSRPGCGSPCCRRCCCLSGRGPSTLRRPTVWRRPAGSSTATATRHWSGPGAQATLRHSARNSPALLIHARDSPSAPTNSVKSQARRRERAALVL